MGVATCRDTSQQNTQTVQQLLLILIWGQGVTLGTKVHWEERNIDVKSKKKKNKNKKSNPSARPLTVLSLGLKLNGQDRKTWE